MHVLKKALKIILIISAFFFLVVLLWMVAGFPLFFDRICIFSQAPADADYIVCVGAGLTTGNLPTDDGWGRIYTAVQLYLDGFGKKIIFTGGGSGRVSEAEVYAEAAHWLGMNESDRYLDPGPNQTSEHPGNIQRIPGIAITAATPVNIVTSPLHSKRTALCFKKAGYSNFRLVTSFSATGRRTAVRVVPSEKAGEPPARKEIVVSRPGAVDLLRAEKTSTLPGFRRSGKVYDDLFIKMRARSWRFFTAFRELAAMAVYKIKGYI
jgi:uncharacterized SAM-binding protein YcdF (DUF218 family)